MKTYLTFETERLFLRPTCEEDVPFILELLNTPKALQYVGDRNCTVIRKTDGAKLEDLRARNYGVGECVRRKKQES